MAEFINIDQIEEGMILAEAVKNKFGSILLPAGAKLSSNHKNVLKTWRISSVYIKTDEIDDEFEFSEEILTQAKFIVNEQIDWKPKNNLEQDIINLAIMHNARKLTYGKD